MTNLEIFKCMQSVCGMYKKGKTFKVCNYKITQKAGSHKQLLQTSLQTPFIIHLTALLIAPG